MKRRFKFGFGGDDSCLWLIGRQLTPAELEVLESHWALLGHRPKLFMRKNGDVAEFCGWKIVVDDTGLDETTAVWQLRLDFATSGPSRLFTIRVTPKALIDGAEVISLTAFLNHLLCLSALPHTTLQQQAGVVFSRSYM